MELVPGVLTKLEYRNPGASHKTRAARWVIRAAAAKGLVVPGVTTVIEKTGGNFGLGLAIECARMGVSLELVIGLGFSKLKRRALTRLGVDIVGDDMLYDGATPREVLEWRLANQERLDRRYYHPDQFHNFDSVRAHYHETGVELVAQLRSLGAGKDVPLALVGGAGTGASLQGVGERLREEFEDVEVVLIDPPGCRSLEGVHEDHPIEGIAVGVKPPFLRAETISRTMTATLDAMSDMQKEVGSRCGFLLGNSAAAALSCARRYCEQNPRLTMTLAYDELHWYL
jgi:cysteine synthase